MSNRLANKSNADQLLSSFPASKLHCEGGASDKLPAFASTYEMGKAWQGCKTSQRMVLDMSAASKSGFTPFCAALRLQSVASVSLQVLIVYLSQVHPSTYTAFLLSSFYHEKFHPVQSEVLNGPSKSCFPPRHIDT